MTTTKPTPKPAMSAAWWITTDRLAKGGEKIMGPFVSRDLALDVRTLLEASPRANGRTFWVDEER